MTLKSSKSPQRMCVSCREMKDKSELLRVVRGTDGRIFADSTGKANGRGAYICKDAACWANAKKCKRFSKAFGCEVAESVYDLIYNEIEN